MEEHPAPAGVRRIWLYDLNEKVPPGAEAWGICQKSVEGVCCLFGTNAVHRSHRGQGLSLENIRASRETTSN